MAKKKKVLTAAAAVVTATAIMLGGTFAWQSISQTALNEASDVINPGGRLHDDFNGENKDVYVENFAEEDIYARIRLSEYFEIVTNYGAENPDVVKSNKILGDKTTDEETGEVTYTYELFTGYDSLNEGVVSAAKDAEGNSYWSWTTGGSTVYMPTFNMNKDSLQADINGNYVDDVGGISNRDGSQYENYVEYADGEEKTDMEIYDADSNDVEDENTTSVEATHTAKSTESGSLISMAEWDGTAGPYWVYDTDGWVYWAQAIAPDTATGLLLDGISLNQVMDDTWYYAINVEAQFVTADDVGKKDGTGFYVEGTAPTAEAEALLKAIGVFSVDEDGSDNGSTGGTTDPNATEVDFGNSSPTLSKDEATGVQYLELDYARVAEEEVNVWTFPSADSSFTLTSDHSDVYFTKYGETELATTGTDMDIHIPASVTEDVTIVATGTDSDGNSIKATVMIYVKDPVDQSQKPARSFIMDYAFDQNNTYTDVAVQDGGTYYLCGNDGNIVNNWYKYKLSDGAEANWSVACSGGLNPLTDIYDTSIDIYDNNTFGTAKITAIVDGYIYEMTLIVCDYNLKINDWRDYVYTGAAHTLSFEHAVSYELATTGHASGTYIDGNTLYVDENETVAPQIKINTVYGSVVVGTAENHDEIGLKGADKKWMIINDDRFEVEDDSVLWGEDSLSVYYEGKKVYVRLNESDSYTQSVTGPEQDESSDVEFTLYANTKADGSGESHSWNLTVYQPY